MTHYLALAGFKAPMAERRALSAITDGTANTILVVEAAEPTIWTRPDDLPFHPNGPLPKFGLTPDGFLAVFCDATVRFFPANWPEMEIREAITCQGGELVRLPEPVQTPD